jgi:hypothetical protein
MGGPQDASTKTAAVHTPGFAGVLNNERTMAADPLDDYIDAVSKALGLPVEDAWKPAVRASLEVSLRLARQVDEFALPDETEPASVFAA